MADDLRPRARRAYELGQLRAALGASAWTIPAMAIALVGCGRPELALGLGGPLFAAATIAGWRRAALRPAIASGTVAGIVAMVPPVLWCACGACSIGGAGVADVIVCALAGAIAGAGIAVALREVDRDRGAVLGTAGLVALATGSLGCVAIGVGGALGMALAGSISIPLATRALAKS